MALGLLWAFDGDQPRNLSISLLDAPGVYDAAEGRLVVVTKTYEVVVTTDLETWTCVGVAPPDVTSIGVVDGTIYFGATEARIFAFDEPAW